MRVALMLILVALAGCISEETPDTSTNEPDPPQTPPQQPPPQQIAELEFNTSQGWSQVLEKGQFDILPVESIFIDVDLPETEGGAAVDPVNPPRIHMGLWLPDVPEGTVVPVIADVGPYYDDGDVVATTPANRLGGFLIENFVPHGYAVAQVSVFGSGESNHCFDMFGNAEQLGVHAAVEYLGKESWSNGNVSLIGRSYDGSTPWMAAAHGSEHLKTIVPISGLVGLGDLVVRNGSVESRAATFHNVIYGTFGIDGDVQDAQHATCPDYLTGTPWGATMAATGGDIVNMEPAYWSERTFLQRALDNYEGSIFLIHGLQDWNVDPHMAFPVYQMFEDQGTPMKGLFGQWAHMYPDRPSEHQTLSGQRGGTAYPDTVRYDWAEDLKVWFDYYLKGAETVPNHHVEVQGQYGQWRVEETYPPRDADWVTLDGPASVQISPVSGGGTYDLGVLNEDENVTIGGHIYLEATATPSGPGGQVFFQIYDSTANLYLGYGIMDLRYSTGTMQPVTPLAMPLRIQSQALDTVVEAGNRLQLRLSGFGESHLPSPTDEPVTLTDVKILVPSLDRDASVYFQPPAWE